MSDSDSIGSSPGRSLSSNINNPRRIPLDFPIRTGTLNDGGSLGTHIAGLIAEFQELHRNIEQREAGVDQDIRPILPPCDRDSRLGNFHGYSLPAELIQGTSGTGPPVAMGPSIPAQRKVPKKPATTLISTLPQSTYTEKEDSTERTLAYVTVQRALLDYLGKRASDTLSARQACAWTRAIDPRTKTPAAKHALRLCYYMRSQGFDTYAEIKEGIFCLYVADQDGKNDGSREKDTAYWKQDFSTHQILYSVSSETRTSTGRRNAIVAGHTPPVGGGHTVDVDAMFAGMRGSDSWGSRLDSVGGQDDDGQYDMEDVLGAGETDMIDAALDAAITSQVPAAPQPQPYTQEQARTRLQAQMAGAQANLNAMLSAQITNPGMIEGAIARVEGLQRHLDQV